MTIQQNFINNFIKKKFINNKDKTNENKKSIPQKIIRFLLFAFVAFILITTAICFGLSISTSFRQFAISQITKIANRFLIAEIQIKDIHFNRISGISIDKLRILTDGDTLAFIEKLNIDVNFESFFSEILIHSLEIENPRIKLLRSTSDSIWNFNKIVAAPDDVSPPDTTPSTFGMKINSLIIKNGYFIYYDSLNPNPTYKEFQINENLDSKDISKNISNKNVAQKDIIQKNIIQNHPLFSKMNFSKMTFSKLNLKLRNTRIKLDEMLFATSIAELSATELNSEMTVDKISLDAELSTKGIFAKNAYLKLQDAELEFDASMKNINFFREKDISKAEIFVDLSAKNFDPKFIDNFAFIPVHLGFIKKLNVLISGNLQDMSIKKILLNTYQSHIELTNARTTNLLNPQKLTYEGTISSTFIHRNDFANILQNINLTAVPNFVYARINDTKIFGTLDSVDANFDLKTGIGDFIGKAYICFSQNPMKYGLDLTTNNLNLAEIIDNNLTTKINSKIKIIGSDINPKKMKTLINIDFLPSKINDIDLFDSKIALHYLGQDSLIINDFTINFANHHFPTNNYFAVNYLKSEDNEHSKIGHSKIKITGGANIKDLENPHLNIEADFKNINFNHLLKNENLPIIFSSKFKINIQGSHFDNMIADAMINIEELNTYNKSMFPFEIRARIRTSENRRNHQKRNNEIINENLRNENPRKNTQNINRSIMTKKSIRIEAKNHFEKIFSIDITGDITANALLNGVFQNISNIAKFITNKLNTSINDINFVPNKKEVAKLELENPIQDFPISNFDIKFELKSLNFLDILVSDFNSNNTDILGKFTFNSTEKSSVLNMEQFSINVLNFSYERNIVNVKNLYLSGLAQVDINNSTPNLTKLGVKVEHGEQISFIKDLTKFNIDTLLLSTSFDNDKFNIDVSGSFNSIVRVKLEGGFEIDNENIQVYLDSLICRYQNEFWQNSEQIKIFLSDKGIDFQNFEFFRKNKEYLSISGKINNENIDNLNIKIRNFEIYDLNNFVFSPLKMDYIPLSANLDSLSILLNGNFIQPIIKSSIVARNLVYNKQFIGHFNSNINYQNDKIYGNANLFDSRQKKLFEFIINSIPIYIGLDEERERIVENKPVDINITMNQLGVQFLSQLIPAVDNIRGKVNGELNIGGFLPDRYNYKGNIELDDINFRLMPTNMEYSVSGKVAITTDYIAFNGIRIQNNPDDLRNGVATISGKVELDKFELKYIDVSLRTNRFQVLGYQTEVSMPWFFGRMIIDTDVQPLRFFGTLNEPNLTGSVTVLNADLRMPQVLADEVVRRETKFTYINKNILRIIETTTINKENSDSKEKLDLINQSNSRNTNSQREQNKDIVDLLNIDISARIRQLAITLELGQIGQIYAKIGTTDPQTPIRYVKERTQAEAKIFNGELQILDGSTVQIFRTMSARGVINFPTARISQPQLDLNAECRLKVTNQNGGTDLCIVHVNITGTANKPIISLLYSINGNPVIGEQKQIESDAIKLLATGTIDNQINTLDLANEGRNFLASQFASKTLTELLIKTGVVQSANLKFEGDGLFNAAEFNISGSIAGVAMWTIGGQIQDITSNYEVSIDIPVNINKKALDNLIFQISKATNLNNSTFDKNAKNWEVKLKLDGKW